MRNVMFPVLCAISVFLSGCSSVDSSPKDAPVKLYTDISKNEINKAVSNVYYKSQFHPQMSGTYSNLKPEYKKILQGSLLTVSKEMINSGALTGITVKSHSINGDSGVVVLDLHFGNGKNDVDVEKVKKVDGKWYDVIVGP
jgi:GMP synthase-like glutamine amidotransferase